MRQLGGHIRADQGSTSKLFLQVSTYFTFIVLSNCIPGNGKFDCICGPDGACGDVTGPP